MPASRNAVAAAAADDVEYLHPRLLWDVGSKCGGDSS